MRKYVSRRCTYHRECDIIWKMDGSKCEDVEVGPFADKDFDQPMESGKNDIQFTVIAMFIFKSSSIILPSKLLENQYFT